MNDVYVKTLGGEIYRLIPIEDAEFDRITKDFDKVVGIPAFINASQTKLYPLPVMGIELVTLAPFTLRSP
jgi:hypothetical protein